MDERIMIVLMLIGLAGLSVVVGVSGLGTAQDSSDEPRICTKEFMPVCGVDGVTYGNACEAGDVEIAYQGECNVLGDAGDLAAGPCGFAETPSEKLDGRVCAEIYAPVCGVDGITYGNECMAGSVAIAHLGECR